MIRKSLNSLAGKLIIAVGTLITLGSVLFGFTFMRYEESIMMNNLMSYASSTADLVKRAVDHYMLTSHREAIEQTVEVIGSSAEIKDISIFDKTGRIAYSSRKSAVGRTVGKESATCRICHEGNGNTLAAIPKAKNWTIEPDQSGNNVLKFVIPIYNESSCSTAPCHYHPKEKQLIGILETNFSTSTVDEVIRKHRIGTIFFGGLFIIMISSSLCIILYKFVSKPVSLLDKGMQKLAKGELDHVIEIHSGDEMGLLANTFNTMASDIKRYKDNMENWTKALEEEIQKKTSEIMKAHDQLINAEKLASLGRMAAGVAHELNSPLTGIVTFSHLMLRRIPPENTQDIEDLEVIIEQAERCSKIIKGLLGFSRKTSAEKVFTNINTLTENTISMVRNQAKFYNIKFNLNFDESIPAITTDPNQLQQVFINLLINAADAMNERGQVTVSTRVSSDTANGKKYVEIEFTDTGPGIPEEHLGRVFEPFFTTKPVGKGTGLGLAVSYGIIKKHNGNIFVRSEIGKGASFFVRLPVESEPAGDA
ncbi:MAG TPA: ATP-binding protein [Thermodesulfovibrionales bacterium]|nr:ATP-binding protein [Thermodesulfovibrionales bacterium]